MRCVEILLQLLDPAPLLGQLFARALDSGTCVSALKQVGLAL
jgi:hypothetical protein